MKHSRKIILLMLLMGLWSGVIFAQETGADEALMDWSPDGTQLVITSNRTGQPELYVIDIAGNTVSHLLEGQAVSSASWSSEGQIGVILGDLANETIKQLHLVNPTTGESALLATLPASYGFQVLWSPDGQRIALANQDTILVVNVSDGAMQTLGEEFEYPRLEWSPNSQFIAVVAKEYPGQQSEGVFSYDVIAQTRSSNLLSTYWKRETPCCLTSVAWSPDSTQLAIAVMLDANIYISTIATETLVPVAHTGGGIVSLKWASDGSAIYYHLDWRTDDFTLQEALEGGRSGGVYRANLSEGSIELVSLLGTAFNVGFSPNSDLFYASEMDYGVSAELLSFGNVADGNLQPLQMDFFKVMSSAWSLDSTKVAVALCDSSAGDVDIYLVDPTNGNAVNITQEDAFTGEQQPSNCPGMG